MARRGRGDGHKGRLSDQLIIRLGENVGIALALITRKDCDVGIMVLLVPFCKS